MVWKSDRRNPDVRLNSVEARKRLHQVSIDPFWGTLKNNSQHASKATLSTEPSCAVFPSQLSWHCREHYFRIDLYHGFDHSKLIRPLSLLSTKGNLPALIPRRVIVCIHERAIPRVSNRFLQNSGYQYSWVIGT